MVTMIPMDHSFPKMAMIIAEDTILHFKMALVLTVETGFGLVNKVLQLEDKRN